MGKSDPELCFVISPIGDEGSATRHRSDQVLKHIIKPAAREAGFDAQRADEIDKPGLITSQVIQRVISDPLVIADLTGMNPNVFYELAIRHAIRKPMVQLIQKGERIPFDVAATRTIHVDHQDLDSVDSAKQQIIAQIKEVQSSPENIETPISVSMDLQILRQSDDPEDRSLAEILAEISDIKASVAKVGEKMESSDSIINQRSLKRLEYFLSDEMPMRSRKFGDRRTARALTHFVSSEDSSAALPLPLFLLVVVSYFRESAPWLHTVGTELYQRLTNGSKERARKSLNDFRQLAELTIHHPIFREMTESGGEEYTFILRKTLDQLIERINHEL